MPPFLLLPVKYRQSQTVTIMYCSTAWSRHATIREYGRKRSVSIKRTKKHFAIQSIYVYKPCQEGNVDCCEEDILIEESAKAKYIIKLYFLKLGHRTKKDISVFNYQKNLLPHFIYFHWLKNLSFISYIFIFWWQIFMALFSITSTIILPELIDPLSTAHSCLQIFIHKSYKFNINING